MRCSAKSPATSTRKRSRMKRQITGLYAADRSAADQIPDGVFLVRVRRAKFQRQARKPYYTLTLAILEPSRFAGHVLSSRLYCGRKALWKLNWFLRDFGYDTELLGRDEVDEKQLVGSEGRGQDQPHRVQRRFPAPARRLCSRRPLGRTLPRKSGQSAGGLMTYSYTQISQYLTCPRRYRHRYLDGWKEKDTRAAMLFGRAFEQALGALFRREDPGAVLFAAWSACQSQDLHFSNRDSWDRMLRQGIALLTRFCQDDRVRVCQPQRNLQVKFTRQLAGKATISLPTSTPSGNSMASDVCWSGKPVRADIRKNLRGCCLWIRSWFVIRG